VSFDPVGGAPAVEPVSTAQFRWQQREYTLQVPSDLERVIAEFAQAESRDVLDVAITGQLDLASHSRLQQALGITQARARCLRCDLSALQLAPTSEDIAALHADGYLGEVITELRETAGDDARRAQDALAILTGLLAERKAREASA
jgi:hypothetical protein